MTSDPRRNRDMLAILAGFGIATVLAFGTAGVARLLAWLAS